tara:strand:- start:511 stop:1839 length:1329 start_codon:yes stop_codon:yes gene_type:complete
MDSAKKTIKTQEKGYLPRALSLDILDDVVRKNGTPDDRLDFYLKKNNYLNLPREDIALCKTIVMTTLRRWAHIEQILLKYLKKTVRDHSPRVHLIIMIAICQLVFLQSPPYAVVNLAIIQTKNDKKSHKLKNLVNAILRKVSEDKDHFNIDQFDNLELIPKWMIDRWKNFYTSDEIKQIADSVVNVPTLDITLKKTDGKIAEELGGRSMITGNIRINKFGFIPDIQYYHDGKWWVQDVAACIPVKLIQGHIKNKRVVDLCAAPGGKTANLIDAGAKVTAIDSSIERLDILKRNLKRLNFEADVVHADSTRWITKLKYDGVLIDAPCSSTGVIRKNPDILRRKTHNLDYLTNLQHKLLINGIELLKKGGLLVYCTCSIEKEEGEYQIERIMDEREDIIIKKISTKDIGIFQEFIHPKGYLRILPNTIADGGNDGFFISILKKK